jgi:hypothetical protein
LGLEAQEECGALHPLLSLRLAAESGREMGTHDASEAKARVARGLALGRSCRHVRRHLDCPLQPALNPWKVKPVNQYEQRDLVAFIGEILLEILFALLG